MIARWLAGGTRPYHTLYHCMNGDVPWVMLTVSLDLTVALGYVLIAWHWRKNEQALAESPAKSALRDMKMIFLFCGLCGYLFIPIKMYWPAWRLYDGVLLALAFFTWRYALGARTLKVVYNELERSAKLAADLQASREESTRKSFFLNAVSHDLRTPLNGLILQTELAELSLEAGDHQGLLESFEYMKMSVRSSTELLERFLEFARADFGQWPEHLSRFDLRELVQGAAEGFQARAEQKGLGFVITSGAGTAAVTTDRMKLERILSNLIANAIKFTDAGRVGIDVSIENDRWLLSVWDTGIGIDPKETGRIFEEFFQVDNRERNSDKGYGLGLAIASQLARQIGGLIRVESEPGRGSRFTVVLPQDSVVPPRSNGPRERGPLGVADPDPEPAAAHH